MAWYISYDYESRTRFINLGFGKYKGATQEDAINQLLDFLNKRGAGYRLTSIIACFPVEAIQAPDPAGRAVSLDLCLN